MSEKSDDKAWKDFCKDKSNTPGQIKKASRGIKLVSNWNDIKVNVMAKCIDQKFNTEPFKSRLLATGEKVLREGDNWNGIFWGVSLKTGKGQNILGKLIMDKRQNLRDNDN